MTKTFSLGGGEATCPFCWKSRPCNQLACPFCGVAMPYNGISSPHTWPEYMVGRYGQVKGKGLKKVRSVLLSKGHFRFHDPFAPWEHDLSSLHDPAKMLVFSVLQGAYEDTVRLTRRWSLTLYMKRQIESDLAWLQASHTTVGFSFADCCLYLGFSHSQQQSLYQFFFERLTKALMVYEEYRF